MKKRIALLLSVLMLVTVLIPVQSFAAQDQGLENALRTAKQMFTIPDDYKFDYSVSTSNGKTMWYLNWRDEDGIQGNISVSIDEDGTILSYYKNTPYKPDDYLRQKFPKVSRAQAKTIAEDFIKKVNPDALSHIKYKENTENSLTSKWHYINFVRIENGIPFDSNDISVGVDSETGEVLSYNYNWYENVNFPKPEGVIMLNNAQNAYKDELGVSLIYNYSMEDDSVRIYAVYAPKYNNSSFGIDAFTGEKVNLQGNYRVQFSTDKVMNEKMKLDRVAGDYSMGGVTLTPEELEAVKKVSELIEVDEAEKIARDFSKLELDDTFELSNSNLSRGWPDKEEFNWYLNFTKEPTEEDSTYRHASVTLNAVTGEIKNFYISRSYSGEKEEEVKYDMEASKAAAEKFLKEFKPEKFQETEYFEIYNTDYTMLEGEDAPSYYNFRYTRKVNGAAFPSNGLSVGFDAVTGKVTSFSMEWFNSEFKSLDEAISVGSAYETLFDEIGLELQYKVKHSESEKITPRNGNPVTEVQLVYVLKSGKPHNVDAFTGTLLENDGKGYKEKTVPQYSDIENSFAKNQIMVLAEYGIYLEGTEFKPNQSITQKDFFTLLSKVISDYYGPFIKADSSDKDINDMYNRLIRLGILNENEKTPNSSITREDSVKFIIRALNYHEVADIQGIYKELYKDQSSINPDLVGYVAIASGLKIVSGNNGYFYPGNNLTRAEAAVIIYNYLQR